MKNIYYNQLFNKIAKENFYKNAYFLLEGQPWEKILTQNWKIYQKNKIYGLLNLRIRFWI